MILKKIIFSCLFLGNFAFMVPHWYSSYKIKDNLRRHKHYDEDYQTTIDALSKKATIEPLLFSSLLAAYSGISTLNSLSEQERRSKFALHIVGIMTGIVWLESFFIASYFTKKIIERSPVIQEWVDPEKADDANYYKTKRDEIVKELKKYIKENKISREQIDQIRHEMHVWESSQKKILYDLAKDLPEK